MKSLSFMSGSFNVSSGSSVQGHNEANISSGNSVQGYNKKNTIRDQVYEMDNFLKSGYKTSLDDGQSASWFKNRMEHVCIFEYDVLRFFGCPCFLYNVN